MSSNLPPGVTDSMIPGNRPEDEAEEAFWDALATKLAEAGISEDDIDRIISDDGLIERAINAARDLEYGRGFDDGKMEEALAESERRREAWEAGDQP